jgi:thiol:disulfide interchange protein
MTEQDRVRGHAASNTGSSGSILGHSAQGYYCSLYSGTCAAAAAGYLTAVR